MAYPTFALKCYLTLHHLSILYLTLFSTLKYKLKQLCFIFFPLHPEAKRPCSREQPLQQLPPVP